MSVSIYYTAKRDQPLSPAERTAIEVIAQRNSVDKQTKEYLETGKGLNWEPFGFYKTSDPGIILQGSTKLPDNKDDADWIAIQHWAAVLSEIRRAVPGATWHVHVDDHDLEWDEKAHAYDLN